MGVLMVKKTEDFSFDDDDFFKEFDDNAFGDFKSSSKVSSSRKVIADFGGSFLSGVKKSLLNPSNQRKILEQNLPDGYAQTFDAVSMGAQGIKDLYSTTREEVAKQAKDFVEPATTLSRLYGKFLPKGLKDRVDQTLENHTHRTYSAPSEKEEFDSNLDEIFTELTDVNRSAAISNKVTQVESTNRIVTGQMAQTAVVGVSNRILSNISNASDRMVSINTATAKLMRKNVELTFKQFVLQRKIVDELEQTRKMQFDAFGKIIKNTAMPEVIKATNWELAAKNVRGKLIGMATERVTAKFGPVASQIFDQLKTNITDKVQGAGGTMSMMLSMLAMQGEMEEEMGGPSRASRAGGIAGSIGAWGAQKWLRNKIGDRFKDDPRFQRFGDAAMNFMDSAPGMFNRLQGSYGITGQLLSSLGLGDILVPDSQARTKVRGNTFKHFDEVTAYNKKSDLALTEVIPGLLGKLHQSVESLRTGQDAEEIRYDYEKSGFTTVSDLKERTLKQMYNKTRVKDSRKHAHIVVNRLDSKGELSKKDRALLMRYVLEQANSDVGYVDPKALMDPMDSPIAKYDADAAERIAEVLANENNFNFTQRSSLSNALSLGDRDIIFGNLNSDANYQSKMRKANDSLKALRGNLPNSMQQAIQQASVGNMDVLRDIGAVKWDEDAKEWRFDREAFYDNILSGKMPNIKGGPSNGGTGTPYSPPPPSPLGGTPPPMPGPGPSPIPPSPNGPIGTPPPPPPIPPDLNNGPAGFTDFQNELLATLERVSAKTSVDMANQILEAIRERLDQGIPQGGPSPTPEQQDRKSRWYRNILGSSMSMAGRGVKNLFKFSTVTAPKAAFKALVQTPFRIVRGITDLPGRAMSAMGFRGPSRVVDSSNKKFAKLVGDIYVKGKEAPVIKLADLKAGKYFDQKTNKVIKTFKDITGAIVDEAGNVVVSEDEYREGIYTIVEGKRFSIIGGALKLGFQAVKSLAKLPFMSANFAFKMVTAPAKFVGKAIWGMLTAAKDVYVAGETSPRLLARIMRNGGYFNTDGSPIKSVSDIKGAVVDATGDTILTVADIGKGLVDKRGKPFKTITEKVRDIAFAPFKLAGKAIAGAAKLAWKASTAPFKIIGAVGKGVGNLIKGRKDKNDVKLELSARAAKTVQSIYELLKERLPKPKGSWNDRDGSGFRDGSREDQMSDRDKDKGAPDGGPAPQEGKEKKGILGMLMAIAGGLGGVLGAIKGWAGNIFGLMRMAAQTRMATSALGALGALGGRGKRGLGSMFGKMKNFFMKTKFGRVAAIGGLALAGMGLSRTSFASDMFKGASSAVSGNEQNEIKAALAAAGGLDNAGSSSDNSSSKDDKSGDEPLTFMDRIKNGVGGSVIGELGAIAAFPAAAMLYSKLKGTRIGSRLPELRHPTPNTAQPETKMGKLAKFAGTTKGRMLIAALTGAGFVGAHHAYNGGGGDSLAGSAATGFGATLGMDLAAATALPWVASKLKDKWDAHKARKAGIPVHSPTPYQPYRPAGAANLASRTFTPVTAATRAPTVAPPAYTPVPPRPIPAPVATPVTPPRPTGATSLANRTFTPVTAATRAPMASPSVTLPTAPPPAAPRAGLMSKAAELGKGIFRNAGMLGTGYALYDAATTEGTMWDKTKAFGTSLVTSAAIGKGISLGGKLFSAAGRQGLKTGAMNIARTVGTQAGRQVLMQGARSALMYGGTALASTLGAPVVLGGLALAAAGFAAWKGYKYFFGTDKNAIIRFRMAQYGFKLSDKDKVTAIGRLEQLAQQATRVGADGKASFTSNIKPAEIFKIFGIQPTDKENIDRFVTWFSGRFKPVFLQCLASYQSLTKKKDMEKADSLSKKDKLQLLNSMSSISEGNPYSVMVSPFPDGKKLSFDADDVKGELKKALKSIDNEKGPGDKSMVDKAKDVFSSAWDKTKSFASDAWDATKNFAKRTVETLGNIGQAGTNVVKSAWEFNKNFYGSLLRGDVKGAYNTVKDAVSGAGDFISNTVATMTGDQKAWQMRVYTAFKNAGFSEQQARILTAEIGRENSYNPKYLFGGHADPHKGTNLGMLSWQGDRKPRLISFLKQANVLDGRGDIVPGQAALDAQARFIMWELKNTHKKVGAKFLANPNISYTEGSYLIGKSYILWRIDDPKYSAKGKKNRDGFYNMLLKQLGAKDGDAKSTSTPSVGSGNIPVAVQKVASSIVGGNSGHSLATSRTLEPGNGVRLPAYQTQPGGQVLGPVEGGIVSGGVPSNHRAVKAATFATRKAHAKSTGFCARYVANALQSAGYKFVRQVSAFMYANGSLASAGFTKIQNKGQYQIGDVMVYGPHGGSGGGGIHGHIQIYNGRNWVSDFIQRSVSPGSKYSRVTPTLWRDSTLLNTAVEGSVKAKGPAPTDSNVDTKPDQKSAPKTPTKTPPTKTPPTPPPVVARPQTQVNSIFNAPKVNSNPDEALRGLAGGTNFLAEHPTATPKSDNFEQTKKPDPFNLQNAIPNIVEKATTSVMSTKAAERKQKSEEQTAASTAQAILDVNKQQLDIQESMLEVLKGIRDGIGNLKVDASSNPTEDVKPSQNSSARAADMIRQKSHAIPVSMSSIKH